MRLRLTQKLTVRSNPPGRACRFVVMKFESPDHAMAGEGFTPPSGGDTAVRLLQAACELAGGEERLARRLKISVLLLRRYMAERSPLPEALLLATVDLLLEEREARFPLEEDGGGGTGANHHGPELPT
jgi:hypothetical protein